MSSSHRGRPKKLVRSCACGYTPAKVSNLRKHVSICPVVAENFAQSFTVEREKHIKALEAQVAADREQLHAKDEQLAAKDRQIEELIRCAKRPRTETHNVTNQQINVFGRESLEHITSEKLRELLTDPDTSVARLVTLKQTVDANRNVRVPNAREKWVQVYREGR